MSIATNAALIDLLRKGHLLEPPQLEEVRSSLLDRFADPLALARELIRRNWLTPYQVNQLFQGRAAELVLGSYVLQEKLGAGGMGQVFKARNWKLGTTVAVKVILKERLADPELVKRFEREIRAAAQLDHPNIVRAYDADEVGGTYLFVMEYVAGADLSHLVKKHGPLPVAQACDYIRQAALGLQHAFERGMVHRDVKPHNLLVTADGGTVKVLDLGLARVRSPGASEESSTALTREGYLMGTLDYLAPEQAANAHRVDIRADLYSLGCTFYFLLTGRVPFPGGGTLDKLIKHREGEPVPVEQMRPEVPAAVAAIVRRLLAKRPEDRFQTPAELAEVLPGAAASAPMNRGTTNVIALPPQPPATDWAAVVGSDRTLALEKSWWQKRIPKSRRGWGWLAAAIVLLLSVLLLGVALWRRPGPTPTPQPALPQPPAPLVAEPPRPELKKLAPLALTLRLRATLAAHDRGVSALAFAPDGKVLASAGLGGGGNVKLWDPAEGTAIRTFAEQSGRAFAVAFSRDGSLLAAGGQGGKLHVWETGTGKVRDAVAVNTGGMLGVAFSPDGNTLAWCDVRGEGDNSRGFIRFRNLHSEEESDPLEVDRWYAHLVTFSADCQYLATAGHGAGLRVFDAARHREIFARSAGGVCPCAGFTPDSKVVAAPALVVMGEIKVTLVRLWGVPNGEARGTLPGHAWVNALGFSPDGTVLAVGCDDGTVKVWDWQEQRLKVVLAAHDKPVRAVAFSPDGRTLASAGDDGNVKLWDVLAEPPAPVQFDTSPPPLAVAPFSADEAKEYQKRWAVFLKRAVTETNTLGMALSLIPPGEFDMGSLDTDVDAQPSEKPRHRVRLPRPCYLGACEVSVGQFAVFVKDSGYKTEAESSGEGSYAWTESKRKWELNPKVTWRYPARSAPDSDPVTCVSWNDAQAFCQWLSKKEGKTYRLPTEAEWENACRAGSPTTTAFGERLAPEQAVFGPVSSWRPAPVGARQPNAFGLQDMHGNVREWCADWYDANYYLVSSPEDPRGPLAGSQRVWRGGSYDNTAASCRSAARDARPPSYRVYTGGFRVACEVGEPGQPSISGDGGPARRP